VLTREEFWRELTRIIDQFFLLSYVQILVAFFVAVMGIVNTLFVSITDRMREIAERMKARQMELMEAMKEGGRHQAELMTEEREAGFQPQCVSSAKAHWNNPFLLAEMENFLPDPQRLIRGEKKFKRQRFSCISCSRYGYRGPLDHG